MADRGEITSNFGRTFWNIESVTDGNYPDAVLVRKVFAKREKRVERRKWMLKRIIQTKTDVSRPPQDFMAPERLPYLL